MGSERRPSCLDAGQGHPGVEVQGGQAVGQLVELPGGQFHLVDRRSPRGARPWRRSVEPHGQSGQRPDRASAGDDPIAPPSGTVASMAAIGAGAFDGQLTRWPPARPTDRRSPVSSSPRIRAVPRATLATEPHRVDGADAGLQAPAAEVQPEHGCVPDPHAGPLAEKAEPGLLLAGQQGDRAAQDPLHPGHEPVAVVGVPQCGGGHGHHHVGPGVLGGDVQALDGANGEGRPVAGDPAGAGHLGPEVQERPPAEHRARAGRRGRRRPP